MTKTKRPPVTIRLPPLDYIYLTTVVEAAARRPCRRSNCGTVCLCPSCAARRVLPLVDNQKVYP